MISIIAAMDSNRLIGRQNQLPWHLPADLQHFKQLTLHKPIIMGRKTYESIGKPLPRRRNIVVTTQKNFGAADCDIAHSIEEAITLTEGSEEAMVIGGANIYSQALPLAQRLYLTHIDHTFRNGDAYFPEWSAADWKIAETTEHYDTAVALTYRFITYIRA